MKRLPNFLLMMLTTVLLATFITSCSSGEDTVEIDPSKPRTPISDDDWQTIPVSGGTISKDSVITITFPSGTFSKDTKVAVTEVKKGETAGDYEVSKFYQITMPLKIDRTFTVKIKCAEKANDILFVASTLGYRKSSCDYAVQTIGLDGTYANGEYMLTLPATNRKEDDGSSYITLGLTHRIDDTAKDRVSTRSTEGKVGNVKWYFDTTWNYKYWLTSAQKKELPSWKPKFNKYITEALGKIHDLKFMVRTDRQIPIYFINQEIDDSKPKNERKDAYGYFNQNFWYDEWSSISFNMVRLLRSDADTTEIKQTVIHELMHYYQADYDNRGSGRAKYDEAHMLCEAGSVWAEQFMDNGRFNNKFIGEYLPWFLRSLYDLKSAWEGEGETKNDDDRYTNHGYALSVLLYYFQKKMHSNEIDSTKIVEIYQRCNNFPGLGFEPISSWLKDEHNIDFFNGKEYEKFLLSLLTGELIPYRTQQTNININTLIGATPSKYERSFKSDGKSDDSFSCLSFGSFLGNYNLSAYKNSKGEASFKGKEVIIKQLKPDVTTYVIAKSKRSVLKQLAGKTVKGDSIVIKGEDLESLFGADPVNSLYTVNANCNKSIKEGLVSFEIRDAKEEEIPTDVKKVRIYYDIYTNMVSLGEIKARESHADITVDSKDLKVSKSGNTLTISGGMTDARGTINFSFNVNYKSGSWAEMIDLKVTREGSTVYNEGWKYELEASKLKFSGPSGFGYGWEATGDDINKFVFSYDNKGKVTSENIRREENKYNKVAIYIKSIVSTKKWTSLKIK